jgi:hypothetical protein
VTGDELRIAFVLVADGVEPGALSALARGV